MGDLPETGVLAFAYDDGFLHAKTVTVDDYATTVERANRDLRSFQWDFETNTVLYERGLGERYRRIFEGDMERSREITRESSAARSRSIRFNEAIGRWFSGVF